MCGLQFSNADGTYNFNNKIAVSGAAGSGATAGINIVNNSDGTFDFGDIALTDIDGTAFNLSGGTADVTLAGLITQTANAEAAVSVSGGHTGEVTFSEKDTDAGIVTFPNAVW